MIKKILSVSAVIALFSALTFPASAASMLEKLGTVHNLRDYEPSLTEVLTKVAEEAQGKPYSQPEYKPAQDTPVIIPTPSYNTGTRFGTRPSSVFAR